MSRKEKSRIRTDGGHNLDANPFGGLDALGDFPPQSAAADVPSPASALPASTAHSSMDAVNRPLPQTSPTPATRSRGRIDVRREKSGRGGKVVTVVGGEGVAALGEAERDTLLRQLKNRFGCGGRHESGFLELQGNLVEQLQPVLAQMGWRVVRTGG